MKHKKAPHETAHESAHDAADDPKPLADLQTAHAEALVALALLKRAEPRDAEAVLAQKLVVQGLAADIAAHEAAGTE